MASVCAVSTDGPETESEHSPGVPGARAGRSRLLRMLLERPLLSGLTAAIGVIIAVTLAAAVASISTVLGSMFLGIFLALGLDPAVRSLERIGIRRPWGITLVAIAFLCLVAAIILLVVPALVRQFVHLIAAAPETFAAMQNSDWFISLEATLRIDLSAVVADGVQSIASLSSFLAVSGGLLRASFGLVGAISSGFMIVVLTLYFVASLKMMKEAMASLVPAYRRAKFTDLVNQITDSVGGVVAGGITLSSLNALVVFLLQLAIGSSVPALMAIAAFFITLVPMIGSMLFLVIGSLGALFISPFAAGAFLIGYFIYIQIEAYFITPRVMGKAAAVPGVLVIIGAMIGAALMGLLGALVAIPITASILILLRQVVIPRQNAQTISPDLEN